MNPTSVSEVEIENFLRGCDNNVNYIECCMMNGNLVAQYYCIQYVAHRPTEVSAHSRSRARESMIGAEPERVQVEAEPERS
eukprot:1395501-Amorphochlora_amoeboformis.AAC.2